MVRPTYWIAQNILERRPARVLIWAKTQALSRPMRGSCFDSKCGVSPGDWSSDRLSCFRSKSLEPLLHTCIARLPAVYRTLNRECGRPDFCYPSPRFAYRVAVLDTTPNLTAASAKVRRLGQSMVRW